MSIDTLIDLNNDLIAEATETSSVARMALTDENAIDNNVDFEDVDDYTVELIERNKTIQTYFKAQHQVLNGRGTQKQLECFTDRLKQELAYQIAQYSKESIVLPYVQRILSIGTLATGIPGAYLKFTGNSEQKNIGTYLILLAFFGVFGLAASFYYKHEQKNKLENFKDLLFQANPKYISQLVEEDYNYLKQQLQDYKCIAGRKVYGNRKRRRSRNKKSRK